MIPKTLSKGLFPESAFSIMRCHFNYVKPLSLRLPKYQFSHTVKNENWRNVSKFENEIAKLSVQA
jgi:hypothetical protein